MKQFKNLSIERKLRTIIIIACMGAFFMLSSAFIVNEIVTFRKGMLHNISTLSDVVGINSTAAIAFQDQETLKELLDSLRAEPQVVAACIMTDKKSVLATFINSTEHDLANISAWTADATAFAELVNEGHRFSRTYFDYVRPIALNNKIIGSIFIRAGLQDLYYNLTVSVIILIGLIISILILILFGSSKLQKLISNPIAKLVESMRQVTFEKNYSIRVKKNSNDELGVLADGFNEMLEQIQSRDKQLKRSVSDLKNARDAAESASKAKSEFLANMSHELRTPLNHIIGFTELVVDKNFGDLNETQADYLNDVLSSSRHLLSLINDILDLAKVEAGKIELEIGEIDLKSLLERSLVMIKEKAMKQNLSIETDLNKISATIQADERKVKQIVYNLLSNAVKFTPDGGVICLSAEYVKDKAGLSGHDTIKISVQDNGIGIDQSQQAVIFNPFEQIDGSACRKYQGTGLGLALTRQFVELHDGSITVKSEGEGKGSTFSFTLPGINAGEL